MTALNWYTEIDDDGNESWEANAPYVIEEDGPNLKWRIAQKLFDNAIHFVEAHDAELLIVEPEAFGSLAEAQAAIQEKHNECMEEVRKEFEQPA